MYINCHTYYSMRFGTFSEEVLLQLAKAHNIQKLALTDINNTSASLNFVRLASKYNIKPIIGIDFRNGIKQLYVGLAKNNDGFFALNQYLSKYLHSKKPIPEQAPAFENAAIIYPFEQVLMTEKTVFKENEYIGVNIQDLRKIRFSKLYQLKNRFVILQPVTFRNKKDFNTHRLLRAIDNNTLLSKLPEEEEAQEWEKMQVNEELKQYYFEFPFIIQNTEKLMDECSIFFDFSESRKPQNQQSYTGSKQQDEKKLLELCKQNLSYRYKTITEEIKTRLKKELGLIRQMNFVSYFLINWDIIEYAKRKNYYHVGRGSGANSMVAYLLGITNVDPIDLDLYFERFINLYRTSPPDFDIDFSWKDREDVTRYIFKRFDNVALLATYNTFKHSAAVRELGKVFGLPKHEIDILSDNKYNINQLDQLSKLVVNYAKQINGMPNHLSIHAGGILISEKPINYFSATDMPPKGFPTTQFDMVIAEDVGLFKFDILGQRGLAKIKDAVAIVKQNQPNEADIDIHDINRFKQDPKVKELIKNAQCLGCFYVESPAMRMLLKKLEVDNYLGLVAASSIIRPGVAKSGMMREYILRHKNKERRKQAHPVMWELMEETYGIMVYQEDVIKVAHHFAGLSLGEADVLRRGMSGKYRSREEFQKIQEKFIENCRKKGYQDKLIFEIWTQIESFAGYAFAKGHSASYAVESYQSLFLKAYYPLEYMVAVLNNGGGFYHIETYIHEARMLGATIHAPCINKSEYLSVIYGKDIYIGFSQLKDLESKLANLIVKERKNGLYTSFNNFAERIPVSMEQLSILIRIGAFDFTGIDKRNLLWEAHLKIGNTKKQYEQKQLFYTQTKNYSLPKFKTPYFEHVFDELELLGFSMDSPFRLLENEPKSNFTAKSLPAYINKIITIYAYLVTIKTTSTSNKKRMNFGTFIDSEGQFIDTVHFPPVAAKYPFRGRGVYAITGKVTSEFGFLSIEVVKMIKQNYITDPRYTEEIQKKGKIVTENRLKSGFRVV
ncbi:MAG: DNA polymerase III subunit alpha [Bacteroidetes bacterium]|nr:MAG: DNA polymerase III subunit alpha [Bacteroidota bacterium]